MDFRRPVVGTVRLVPGVIDHLRGHRQFAQDRPEAGGILLGRLILGTADVVVDEACGPSSHDRRSRHRFLRARRPAQETVDQAWTRSDGTLIYLGEWHTHPEDDPTPSCIDRRSWAHTVRRATLEQDFLLFVIVGRVSLRVWEVSVATGPPSIVALDECVSSSARSAPPLNDGEQGQGPEQADELL
ncbi:MAG: Mov34/MPN/PAD-1 family protein [Phycisphaerales bacterium]|nr:Mov34/MPN/PAD-1 family protein [Phycisphaerales bacterium]